MTSYASLRKEIGLIAKELVSLETPKFRGQKEEFPHWISKVEQVFTCYNLEEHEKFNVVIKKLRDYALEWWEKYKYRRKKRGKSKIRTWDKLRGKLKHAFAPTSYLHEHLFLPFEGNGFNSSSEDIPFNKDSSMSACVPPSSTSFLCLEEPNSNKDEKILREEASNLVDPPPVFDNYVDDESFELEGQEAYSCPSPLVLDHHLHKEMVGVAHVDPYYDNFIVSLPPPLKPELAKLITMGGQVGNTSEEQPRGKAKKKVGSTMRVLKLFPCVSCLRIITMGMKEALSWVFALRRKIEC